MSSKASNERYHLGVSDEELARLGFQHQVWQEITQRLWALAGFGPGQTLLDLGCGPGFTTLELARLAGRNGEVHALDSARQFTEHLRARLQVAGIGQVSVHDGDVHTLPLEDATIDGAFARWLLCFVEDPRRVCKEVARVLRPGGVFVAWDYFNYRAVGVFPENAAIRRLFDGYYRSALDHGGSYDIGQELPGMLEESGLEVQHLGPINRLARPGSTTWAWVSEFNRGYLPKLVESELMTADEAAEFQAAWLEAESNPATFFFSPPMLGIIAYKIA
jgi:ubiquinone/menaquinone biosynthesis C-methylase UbiE